MYSPPSSSQSRTSIAKGIPLCKHGVHAKLQVVKKGTRVGERFYGCAFWPVSLFFFNRFILFYVVFEFLCQLGFHDLV